MKKLTSDVNLFQSLIKEMNQDLDSFIENRHKLEEYSHYSELLISQIFFNEREKYIFLIEDYLGENLTLFEFRSKFLEMYRKDEQIFENLTKNDAELSRFSISDKSIEFSNLIESIFEYSIDILTDEDSEKSYKDAISCIIMEMKAY